MSTEEKRGRFERGDRAIAADVALDHLRWPHYHDGSLVNLVTSLCLGRGGQAPVDRPLRLLSPDAVASARHVLLWVIDGLGYQHLCSSERAPNLREYLEGAITAVFPPTTATSITTLLTGLPPAQHGLTGWFTHLSELGGPVAVLPFAARLGKVSLSTLGVSADQHVGHRSIFERMPCTAYTLAPARIAHSPFNLAHCRGAMIRPYSTLAECIDSVGRILASDGQPTFTYVYWDQLDRVAHEHGVGSEETADELAAIDQAFARLLDIAAGTDTLIVVTADHGFVDVAPERWILLEAHPELARMLVLPLCGEPRTAYCYVRSDCHREFANYVRAELADYAVAVASRRLVELGAFGPGPDHPRLAERVGDFVLLMRDGWAIRDWLPGEQRHPKLGVHGGSSAAELYVPLVVARL